MNGIRATFRLGCLHAGHSIAARSSMVRLLVLVYCLGTASTPATPASPIVEKLPAQGTNNLVALNGTVNPNGSPAAAWFEWGTTTAYGNTTSPYFLGAGTAAVSVTTALDHLTPGIAYHYRLVATNTAGASSIRDTIYQAPCISLRGANPLTNECHVPFAEPGASSMAQPLAIAAGQHFSLALKFDGTVTGWGGTGNGETSIPATLSAHATTTMVLQGRPLTLCGSVPMGYSCWMMEARG